MERENTPEDDGVFYEYWNVVESVETPDDGDDAA